MTSVRERTENPVVPFTRPPVRNTVKAKFKRPKVTTRFTDRKKKNA